MSGSVETSYIFSQEPINPHSSSISLSTPSYAGTGSSQLTKRKRSQSDTLNDGLELIEIYPLPHSENAISTIAIPLITIERSCLPLAFLSPGCRSSSLMPRFFSAVITTLEDCPTSWTAEAREPQVLVASIGPGSTLYAIERVKEHVYSSCKLANWVTLEILGDLSTLATKGTNFIPTPTAGRAGRKEWWASLVRARSGFPSSERIKVEQADELEINLPVATECGTVPGAEYTVDAPVDKLAISKPLTIDMLADEAPHVALEDSFATVSTQYLEMLYLSQASLAYFAKGPLSRARVACGPLEDSSHRLREFGEFLRLMILSSSSLDKKYKESLPSAIKSLAQAHLHGTPSAPKRKKTKKFKPGKDGLFPEETLSISSWWSGEISGSALPPTSDSFEAAIKTRLMKIRLREHLLQLILILEVLAVETALSKAERKTEANQESHGQDESQNLHTVPRPKSAKEPQDLQILIETIIDRLAIWQSVNSIEVETLTEGQQASSSGGVDATVFASSASRDELKEFCIEVVIPFYASRLGKVAERLARKLGVQTVSSPQKRKVAHQSNPTRPGAEITREDQRRARKSLSRASTTIGRPIPSLMRSATDTLLQEIQRERSNSPNVSFSTSTNARSFSRSNSINTGARPQKQVDLNAHAKLNMNRSKRATNVEQELQDAITTLKKPNRGLAVKEYIDAADTRKNAASKRSQPAVGAGPSRGRNHSQVQATPQRATKTKDMIAATPSRVATLELQPIPSSIGHVPPSNLRPPIHRLASSISDDDGLQTTGGALIADTPSKPGGRHVDVLGIVVDKGEVAWDIPAQPSFTIPARRKSVSGGYSREGQVPQTPQKIRTEQSLAQDRQDVAEPVRVRSGSLALLPTSIASRGTSIYESLGWDDDDLM